jgi:hypothetical protein
MSLDYPGVERDGRAGDRLAAEGEETCADVITVVRPGHCERTIPIRARSERNFNK